MIAAVCDFNLICLKFQISSCSKSQLLKDQTSYNFFTLKDFSVTNIFCSRNSFNDNWNFCTKSFCLLLVWNIYSVMCIIFQRFILTCDQSLSYQTALMLVKTQTPQECNDKLTLQFKTINLFGGICHKSFYSLNSKTFFLID